MHNSPTSPSLLLARRAPEAALVLITVVWGGTFLAVQHALTAGTPMFSSAAAAAAWPWDWCRCALRGITWREVRRRRGRPGHRGRLRRPDHRPAAHHQQRIGLPHRSVPAVPLLQWLVLRAARHDLGRRGAGLHGPDAADRQQPRLDLVQLRPAHHHRRRGGHRRRDPAHQPLRAQRGPAPRHRAATGGRVDRGLRADAAGRRDRDPAVLLDAHRPGRWAAPAR